MTAGAVAVPTIMPLRAPVPGQHKSAIDTNTKIELRSGTSNILSVMWNILQFHSPRHIQTRSSDSFLSFPETSGATIYYTISGSKPEPFQTIGPAAKSTYKYREPFRLPAGRRTVKAIAIGVYVVLENAEFSLNEF